MQLKHVLLPSTEPSLHTCRDPYQSNLFVVSAGSPRCPLKQSALTRLSFLAHMNTLTPTPRHTQSG